MQRSNIAWMLSKFCVVVGRVAAPARMAACIVAWMCQRRRQGTACLCVRVPHGDWRDDPLRDLHALPAVSMDSKLGDRLKLYILTVHTEARVGIGRCA